MRFSSTFLESVRRVGVAAGGIEDKILRRIIEHRHEHLLDNKWSADDPFQYDDEMLRQEVKKLLTIYESIRSSEDADKAIALSALNDHFSAEDINEVVEEYFPELLGIPSDEVFVARP